MVNARRRVPLVLTATALTLSLGLAACGGGDDDSNDDGATNGASSAPSGAGVLGPDKAATGAAVKIGLISDGTTAAISTADEIKGAQVATAYANAKLGGLGGKPIELVVCEEKANPATAADCGNQMVSAKVSMVVAGSPALTDPWMNPVLAAGIPVAFTATSNATPLKAANVFLWGNPVSAFGTPAAYARQKGYKTAALLVIDVPGAVGPAKSLLPAFFRNAGASIDIAAAAPGTPDLTPQLQTVLAKKPEMLMIIGDSTFCTTAMKAAKSLGTTVDIVPNDTCIGKDKGAGIPGGYGGTHVLVQNSVLDPGDAEFKLFAAAVTAYGKDLLPTVQTSLGYQAVLSLVRSFDASGATDTSPAGLSAGIKSAPAVKFPVGGGSTFQCNGKANPAISVNICGTGGAVGDGQADGSVTKVKSVDSEGIYKLG